SYIFDYAIIVILILGFSALDKVEPYKQRFSLNNESLQYPYANPERISPFIAGLIACLFPMLCIIAWTMLIDGMFSHHKPATNRARIMGGRWTMNKRLWEMNCGILGLGLSVAGAICITGALKNATGKPRPDVIARCIPPVGAVNEKVFGLFNPANCTQTDNLILKDGFKSFPSGHSSTAFAGLGYLSLFLAGKLHVMDNRGEVWKAFLVLIPLLAASLIAVSRIMDARHHPFDVVTGSMLGIITAWVAYRQYFPSISNFAAKGQAYPRRSWGTET
ncbi:phosphatidic acid phosphatase type 2/haloperoxidase, partial [Trichophaea hybrida]